MPVSFGTFRRAEVGDFSNFFTYLVASLGLENLLRQVINKVLARRKTLLIA